MVLSLLLYLFKGFLLVIIIASLMAVATSNANAKFLSLTNGRKFLASMLTTACMVLLFFAPFVYAMIELAKALKNLISILSHKRSIMLKIINLPYPKALAF